MEEERTGKEISRRRLIKRLGVGTAAAWLAPIVTSKGALAAVGGCCECTDTGCGCDWTCGGTLFQCGSGCGPFGAAYCSHDVDGKCFCWEDDFCDGASDCAANADCPPGYACVPDTCCGTPKCLAGCGMGPRRRRRHGKTATGKVR
jgi:hypothetical protein